MIILLSLFYLMLVACIVFGMYLIEEHVIHHEYRDMWMKPCKGDIFHWGKKKIRQDELHYGYVEGKI
jgi:hypothetical protein